MPGLRRAASATCGPTPSPAVRDRAVPEVRGSVGRDARLDLCASSTSSSGGWLRNWSIDGVAPGTAVHLALTNSPAFVAAWIATVRLGAWIVPSDPMARTPELAAHIERTRPAVGLYSHARSGDYLPAAAGMPAIAVDEADTELDQLGDDLVHRLAAPRLCATAPR